MVSPLGLKSKLVKKLSVDADTINGLVAEKIRTNYEVYGFQ